MGSIQFLTIAFVVLAFSHSAQAQMVCSTSVLDHSVRHVILALHNAFRTKLALGAIPLAPSGRNIYALTYNCSLEESAQRIADTCSLQNSNPVGRNNIGENIFAFTGASVKVAAFKHAYVTWQRSTGWTAGQNVFTDTLNANGLKNFAQMAWGSTTLMGCGFKECGTFRSVVCHYMAEGAIVNQAVYERGQGCTRNEDCTTFAFSTCDRGRRLCVAPAGASLTPTSDPSAATTAAPTELTCDGVPSILTPAIRKNIILSKHNRIRSDLVMGRKVNNEFRRGSSRMFEIKYDCALENLANKFADGDSICASDEALSSPLGGRNVYISNETFTSAGTVMLTALNAWISEIVDFKDGSSMGTTEADNDVKKMGNFAQMAHWKTTAVGCSIGKCNENRTAVVCRYRVARPATGKVYQPTSARGCIETECKKGYGNATCNSASGLCQLA